MKGKYIASFVGFAPAEDPRLVAIVLLDEPQISYYGGVAAAPAFREIMLQSLHYLGVPPQGKEKTVWEANRERSSAPVRVTSSAMVQEGNSFRVPDFKGVSLRQVLKAAGEFPVKVELKGRGEAVKQSPAPGELVTAGSKIYVEFQPLY